MGSVWKLWCMELDSSTWGPKHQPVTAGWRMPAPKVHVLHIPPSPLLRTPETNLRFTRHPSLPANPQSYSLSRGERPREEDSPVSPLLIGPKRSDGMMADKHFPSWSDSLHLRKETVKRLSCWTLWGSSSLDSLCPEFYNFCFSFLSYCHRNGKASVKCLCLTFLRWVSSPGTTLPAAVKYISGGLLILFFLWLPLNCVADLQISLMTYMFFPEHFSPAYVTWKNA